MPLAGTTRDNTQTFVHDPGQRHAGMTDKKMKNIPEPLLIDQSKKGRRALRLPPAAVSQPVDQLVPSYLLRKRRPQLPEVTEFQVVRHFTRLSQLNFSIDTNFYPLGSCTMKYNPKVNEA